MEARFDPRGNLPSTMIRPISYSTRSFTNLAKHDHRRSTINTLQKPKRKQCYDWIFSSSSNAHVAVDRAAFKKYYPFESYVLTLSDQSRVAVRGVGTVELRIRCRPGGKGDRTVVLENVLHVPDWYCNIFSDVYLHGIPDFDFTWDDFGCIFVIREKDRVRPWGFTENFCGLDKLVLARRHDGRSPMLEDQDREVFSVNLTWSQHQKNLWEDHMVEHARRKAERKRRIPSGGIHPEPIGSRFMRSPRSEPRIRLNDVDGNTRATERQPGGRISSLRASVSSMGLYQAAMSITSKIT